MLKKGIFLIIILAAIGYVALSARPPQEFVLQTDRLEEASGIVHSRINEGIIWTHNDSGGKAEVYAIDLKGKLVATLELKGIKNRDWEDIAISYDAKTKKSYLYIGEIGDNAAKYPSVKVYRVEEPYLNPADSLIFTEDIETCEIVYEDGARDAEALFIEPKSGDIYIISKREEQVGLYRIAKPFAINKIQTAKRISNLPLSWVTAADISAKGNYLLVKTYSGVWQFKCSINSSGNLTLSRKPRSLPYIVEPQGEGLCYAAKGKSYYTLSEAGEVPQVLYFYK
ncbi:MAG: hypothetical protein PHO32_07570 [Candidatus Cloacimonetes bacterium]|nr:hypothetical protein [Candidatus Cloacimonadota bacterium]